MLLIETIVPDDLGPDWSKVLDIHMLTLLGGQQRTRQEYEDLLARSGFVGQREIDTRAGISILEAERPTDRYSGRGRLVPWVSEEP